MHELKGVGRLALQPCVFYRKRKKEKKISSQGVTTRQKQRPSSGAVYIMQNKVTEQTLHGVELRGPEEHSRIHLPLSWRQREREMEGEREREKAASLLQGQLSANIQ